MKKLRLIIAAISIASAMTVGQHAFAQEEGISDRVKEIEKIEAAQEKEEAENIISIDEKKECSDEELVGRKDIDKVVPKENQIVYRTPEKRAEFPGGQSAMIKWMCNNIRYPQEAVENNIQGRVVVKFIIEKDGYVSNIEISKGVNPLLDAEACRLVSKMPRWIPGEDHGERVRTCFYLPVNFQFSVPDPETEQNQ